MIKIINIIGLHVMFYEYGVCSLTLSEEHWLRMSENKVWSIPETKGEEPTAGCIKLHKWELHNCYYLPNYYSCCYCWWWCCCCHHHCCCC